MGMHPMRPFPVTAPRLPSCCHGTSQTCSGESNHGETSMNFYYQRRISFCQKAALILSQTLSDTLPHASLEFLRVLSPQTGSFDIRRTLIVGAGKHGDDGNKDSLWRLHWRPTLRSRLIAVLVFFRGVKNRDADFAVRIDCMCRTQVSFPKYNRREKTGIWG